MEQNDDTCCYGNNKPPKNEKLKDQKDSEVKRNYLTIDNNNGGNRTKSYQAGGWLAKKDFCLDKVDQI